MSVYDDYPMTDGYGRPVVVLSAEIDDTGVDRALATESSLAMVNSNLEFANAQLQSLESVTALNLPSITSQLASIDYNTGQQLLYISSFSDLGANSTGVVKSASGKVFALSCYNSGETNIFIQLWDTATTAGTGTLMFSKLVPPGTEIVIGTDYFTNTGLNFSSKIVFAASVNYSTYSAATAANQHTFVRYY
jgi:hypothetical protein